MRKPIQFLIILCAGCTTTSKTSSGKEILEKNKDVIVLARLIEDHFKRTKGADFTVGEIAREDSLNRVLGSFDAVEIEHRGGYIAVLYKFSANRDNMHVVLTQKEEEATWRFKKKKEIGRNEGQVRKKYDGELRFQYPERFYHLKKIIVKKVEQ